MLNEYEMNKKYLFNQRVYQQLAKWQSKAEGITWNDRIPMGEQFWIGFHRVLQPRICVHSARRLFTFSWIKVAEPDKKY